MLTPHTWGSEQFTVTVWATILYNEFKNATFKIPATFHRSQWDNVTGGVEAQGVDSLTMSVAAMVQSGENKEKKGSYQSYLNMIS